MEVQARYGTPEQQERWLRPLLDGQIRSCLAMTEPDVASSDATNIRASIERDGDEYLVTGRKWWSTGAADPRCKLAVVMGKTDASAPRHELWERGKGFAIAQGRLGPGRIHHCMRLVGVAERAIELMRERVKRREAFGKPLAGQGVILEWIADSRIEIEQACLLTLKAAHTMDTAGARETRAEIAMIKVVAPNVALRVLDRAIQAHGAAGISNDFPLAYLWAFSRALRLADGPDEVQPRVYCQDRDEKGDLCPHPVGKAGRCRSGRRPSQRPGPILVFPLLGV